MGEQMNYLDSISCQSEGYVHNKRARFTHGYLCETCERFIPKDSLEYFMTEELSSIWMALNNREVKFRRGEIDFDLADELKELKSRLLDKPYLRGLSFDDAINFRIEVYSLLKIDLVRVDESHINLHY
jgi:hypothetical protein